ncbi:MAG TPA: MATE family efflux transporter [Flavobacteriaceae bacterium]|nr:MATE family efflux transporter [Flavobacteriaceae bacterium]
MAQVKSAELGTDPIGSLLFRQSLPSAIGILVMSLNIVVDTIFVGNWIGSTAIAAINVVLPVSFFISALGMAIGVGGGSVISRALGRNDNKKACRTFGNEIVMTLSLVSIMVFFGLLFVDTLIPAFGGKGNIFSPAKTYYQIILYGVPILAMNMMGSNTMRAEGKPKYAMVAMIVPTVINLFGDYLLIKVFDFGMAGAAWATTLSYIFSFIYMLWFFTSGRSELHLNLIYLKPDKAIIREISALSLVTLSRQAVVSIVYLIMNNILFNLGGESAVAVYGIIGRMLIFALFPILGITQGFLPIAGYNYGAEKPFRVRKTINKAILYACIMAVIIFAGIQFFAPNIAAVFTKDALVIKEAPNAMRWVFAAIPIIALQLIGAAYFQAIGKAKPALLLTLTRQGFFFIPLVLILPNYFGELGVWISFPIADTLSTIVTAYFLNREIRTDLRAREIKASAS